MPGALLSLLILHFWHCIGLNTCAQNKIKVFSLLIVFLENVSYAELHCSLFENLSFIQKLLQFFSFLL